MHVVRSLNTVTAAVMAEPSTIPGGHDTFVSGNDAKAKAQVINLLALWLRLYMKLQTPNANVRVAH